MLAVFIGENAEGNFRKTVCKLLRKHIKPIEISSEKIMCPTASKGQIYCVFSERLKVIKTAGSIIFLNSCKVFPQVIGERYCIFDSCNKSDLAVAQKSRGDVYSCGLSTRDTLTFSSFTEDGCVISLQRALKRFDGSVVEPFELPVNCQKGDDKYGILCANLLLILLGII